MLNIAIIPALIVSGLAAYAAAEEAVEWKTGRRHNPYIYDRARRWAKERLELLNAEEKRINALIDAKYSNPLNRARLWLAAKIAP